MSTVMNLYGRNYFTLDWFIYIIYPLKKEYIILWPSWHQVYISNQSSKKVRRLLNGHSPLPFRPNYRIPCNFLWNSKRDNILQINDTREIKMCHLHHIWFLWVKVIASSPENVLPWKIFKQRVSIYKGQFLRLCILLYVMFETNDRSEIPLPISWTLVSGQVIGGFAPSLFRVMRIS